MYLLLKELPSCIIVLMLEFIRLTRWRPELIGLVAASLLTRLWQLFLPNSIVFDEVYFKMFAAHYLDGRYFFDIHPPLAKLLLAGYAHLMGLSADTILNGTAVSLRVLPAIAGLLIVPLVWGILRRLGASRPFAFLGAFAILLDNAMIVESRFILMDSMLLLFGLASVYLYLVAKDSAKYRYPWLVLAALSGGAAASIKWTGLTGIALVICAWFIETGRVDWRKRLKELAILICLPVLVYVGSFWLHFALLNRSGDGDAFMSTAFQQTLVGNSLYSPTHHMSFWGKLIELNRAMFEANRTLTATHPYGSRWYTWPLEIRPVYFWAGDTLSDGRQGNIYLLGNPVVWWGVLASIAMGLAVAYRREHKFSPKAKHALWLISAAYLMNYLPFIGVTRVMFIYHYFFAFILSVVFSALLWNELLLHGVVKPSPTTRNRLFVATLLLIAAGFIYLSPLTYGFLLTPEQLQSHIWLPSWR